MNFLRPLSEYDNLARLQYDSIVSLQFEQYRIRYFFGMSSRGEGNKPPPGVFDRNETIHGVFITKLLAIAKRELLGLNFNVG